ncbi:ribonuclease H-like domain-containing protein [Infundibulicybe gibba]|nr:ribonuclease H-like domain-containing protein [Infundibulicybe gibba]
MGYNRLVVNRRDDMRDRSWHWDHYHQGDQKANKSHWKAFCKYCTGAKLRELETFDQKAVAEGTLESKQRVTVTTGKLTVMNNHLLNCDYCPENVKQLARNYRDRGQDSAEYNDEREPMGPAGHVTPGPPKSSGLKWSLDDTLRTDSCSKRQHTFTVVAGQAARFAPAKQSTFEDQLLRAFVSAGWAFHTIEDPEVRKLFTLYSNCSALPHRQQLSSTILTREAHLTNVHEVSAVRKTGEHLFALVDSEVENLITLGLKPIGIAGDAASDERKARLLALKKYPYLLIADCWAHQIPLMLGDYCKMNPKVAGIIDQAAKIIKWFNNHSYALGLLNKEQQDIYKKCWSLVVPVVTRWTAHFCAASRLLDIWKALKVVAAKHGDEIIGSVGKKRKAIQKAEAVLACVWDENWWKELVIVKTHIEPLAIAVNVAQAANIRCDQVVLILARLYKHYIALLKADRIDPNNPEEDENHPIIAIVHSIEKRWAKVDQDLFIAVLFLNPFINPKLRNSSNLTLAMIMGIIRRLYIRVFKLDPKAECHPDLLKEVMAYDGRREMFSLENWPLDELREVLKDPLDGKIDPVKAWELLDPKSPLQSLGVQKTRDCAFVKGELRRQHAKDGTARHRIQRHFGNSSQPVGIVANRIDEEDILNDMEIANNEMGNDDSDTDHVVEYDDDNLRLNIEDELWMPTESRYQASGDLARSFSAINEQLQETVIADEGDEDLGEEPSEKLQQTPIRGVTKIRLFFGQKRLIPISDLFDWSIEAGWDEFWAQGVKHYREEMVFYELMSRYHDDEPVPPSKDGHGAAEPSRDSDIIELD